MARQAASPEVAYWWNGIVADRAALQTKMVPAVPSARQGSRFMRSERNTTTGARSERSVAPQEHLIGTIQPRSSTASEIAGDLLGLAA